MPQTTLDPTLLFKLWHSGAFFCLFIVAAFFALRWANGKLSWFKEPHHAVYVAAALGGLGMLVTTAMQGTTPNSTQVAMAVLTTIALITDPKKVVAATGALLLVFMLGHATACSSPPVKHAEAAALDCAKADILQPLEGQGVTLLEKVAAALLTGASKTALDDGVAQAKADISALPSSLEPAVVDCAIKAAMAAYAPATTGKGFAGGDARITAAATIGQRLLVERGAAP